MHKRQEAGNVFMKSNPKPPRKPNIVQPDPDAPMPQPQRKQVNLQEPFDLNNMGGRKRQEPIANENDNDDSLDYNRSEYFDMNRMNNYLPSFYNNSNNNNGFNSLVFFKCSFFKLFMMYKSFYKSFFFLSNRKLSR